MASDTVNRRGNGLTGPAQLLTAEPRRTARALTPPVRGSAAPILHVSGGLAAGFVEVCLCPHPRRCALPAQRQRGPLIASTVRGSAAPNLRARAREWALGLHADPYENLGMVQI